MIRIAICDDERLISENIRNMVLDFFHRKNLEVTVLQFQSGEELLGCDKSIDVLFLDIQMEGMDGIQTAKKLRIKGYKGFLVFVTILSEMVFRSFEVQPFDYLVKPVEKKQLEKMMERLLVSLQYFREANLLVQRGCDSSIVSFDDIIFCEVIDRKVYLHLTKDRVIDYYDRLGNLEKKLDGRFFKCHRSYLINLKYLKSYKNGTAYMENDKEIPVSRLRSKEFSSVILHYMKEWRL